MKPKSIRWRLILSYAGIALLTALLLGSIMLTMVKRYYVSQEIEYLQLNAEEIASMLTFAESDGTIADPLVSLIDQYAFFSNVQIRILDVNGDPVYDSGYPDDSLLLAFDPNSTGFGFVTLQDEALLSNGENIPTAGITEDDVVFLEGGYMELPGFVMEIVGEGPVSGSSDEIAVPLMRSKEIYLQEYFSSNGMSLGSVEVSNGLAYGWLITRSVAQGWAVAALIAVIFAGLAGFLVSRVYTRPLLQLTEATSQMSEGDLSARAAVIRQDEFGTLAQSFNQMADNVEDHVESLHRFVSDASHELHTPLTVMRSNLELMDTPDTKPVLDQVHRMDTLTRDLLALSRLDAAPIGDGERINFHNIIHLLLDVYSSEAEQKGVNFDIVLEPSDQEILGNGPLLASAVRNLLNNAIKFTPEEGTVRLKMWHSIDDVHLKISNNGIGIPEEDLPQLFSRFHRGRNAAGFEGSGLGLAIVKSIVELHAGQIVASQKGEWTAFEIILPLAL